MRHFRPHQVRSGSWSTVGPGSVSGIIEAQVVTVTAGEQRLPDCSTSWAWGSQLQQHSLGHSDGGAGVVGEAIHMHR